MVLNPNTSPRKRISETITTTTTPTPTATRTSNNNDKQSQENQFYAKSPKSYQKITSPNGTTSVFYNNTNNYYNDNEDVVADENQEKIYSPLNNNKKANDNNTVESSSHTTTSDDITASNDDEEEEEGDNEGDEDEDDDEDDDTMVSLDVERIERLLSIRLLNGYCLLEKACPVCSVPLIKFPIGRRVNNNKNSTNTTKNNELYEKQQNSSIYDTDKYDHDLDHNNNHDKYKPYYNYALSLADEDNDKNDDNELIHDENPISPIPGVPFCVYCEAHVVTDEYEVELLEDAASVIGKNKDGNIFVSNNSINNNNNNNVNNSNSTNNSNSNTNSIQKNITDKLLQKDLKYQQNKKSINNFINNDNTIEDDKPKNIDNNNNNNNKSYSVSPEATRGRSMKNSNMTPRSAQSYSPRKNSTSSIDKNSSNEFFFSSCEDTNTINDNTTIIMNDDVDEYTSNCTLSSKKDFIEVVNNAVTTNNNNNNNNNKNRITFIETPLMNNYIKKPEPPSPAVVTITQQQLLEQGQQEGDDTIEEAKSVSTMRQKLEPEIIISTVKSDKDDDEELDPIIVICSNDKTNKKIQNQSTQPHTNNQQSLSQPPQKQQQQDHIVPSVEFQTYTNDDNHYDEVSTLAYTYDEGSVLGGNNNGETHNTKTAQLSNNHQQDQVNQTKIENNEIKNESINKIVEKNNNNNIVKADFPIPDYEARREIATKVLGAKMMLGYLLREEQCKVCTMPMMKKDKNSIVECVVCPALRRKALREKKLFEQREKLKAEMEKQQNELRAKFEYELKNAELLREKLEEEMILAQQKHELENEFRKEQSEQRQKLEDEIKRVEEQRAKLENDRKLTEQRLRLEHEMLEQKQRIFFPKSNERLSISSPLPALIVNTEKPIATSSVSKGQTEESNSHQHSIPIDNMKSSSFVGNAIGIPRVVVKGLQSELYCVHGKDVIADEANIVQPQKPCDRNFAANSFGNSTISTKRTDETTIVVKSSSANEVEVLEADIVSMVPPPTIQKEEYSIPKVEGVDSKMKKENQNILAELQELDVARSNGIVATIVNNKSILSKTEEEEAKIDREIAAAYQARSEAEAEVRRLAEERKALDQATLLALEEEFSAKQNDAEAALAKAREAMNKVQTARTKVFDTFPVNMSSISRGSSDEFSRDMVDSYSKVHLSNAEHQSERWSILRGEARSVMTRRMIAGWTIIPEFCSGSECENAPLMSDGNIKECVICGGSGSGCDGVYAMIKNGSTLNDNKSRNDDNILKDASDRKEWNNADLSSSPVNTMSLKEIHYDFDTKRNMVSKEIGRRMKKGWTLLDLICPHCVMPLMTDKNGVNEICVVCGIVGELQGSVSISTDTETEPMVIKANGSKTIKNSVKNDDVSNTQPNLENVGSLSSEMSSISSKLKSKTFITQTNTSPELQYNSPSAILGEQHLTVESKSLDSAKVEETSLNESTFSLLLNIRERFNKHVMGNDPPAHTLDVIHKQNNKGKKKAIDPPNSPQNLELTNEAIHPYETSRVGNKGSKSDGVGNDERPKLRDAPERDEVSPIRTRSKIDSQANAGSQSPQQKLVRSSKQNDFSIAGSELLPIELVEIEEQESIKSKKTSTFPSIRSSEKRATNKDKNEKQRSSSSLKMESRSRRMSRDEISRDSYESHDTRKSRVKESRKYSYQRDRSVSRKSFAYDSDPFEAEIQRGRHYKKHSSSSDSMSNSRDSSVESLQSGHLDNSRKHHSRRKSFSRQHDDLSIANRSRSKRRQSQKRRSPQSVRRRTRSHSRRTHDAPTKSQHRKSKSVGAVAVKRFSSSRHGKTNSSDSYIGNMVSKSQSRSFSPSSDRESYSSKSARHSFSDAILSDFPKKANSKYVKERTQPSTERTTSDDQEPCIQQKGNDIGIKSITRHAEHTFEDSRLDSMEQIKSLSNWDDDSQSSQFDDKRYNSQTDRGCIPEQKREIRHVDKAVEEDDADSNQENKGSNHILTLEMPKGFQVHGYEPTKIVNAGNQYNRLRIDTSVPSGGRREPSPGMSTATMPTGLASPSSYAASTVFKGIQRVQPNAQSSPGLKGVLSLTGSVYDPSPLSRAPSVFSENEVTRRPRITPESTLPRYWNSRNSSRPSPSVHETSSMYSDSMNQTPILLHESPSRYSAPIIQNPIFVDEPRVASVSVSEKIKQQLSPDFNDGARSNTVSIYEHRHNSRQFQQASLYEEDDDLCSNQDHFSLQKTATSSFGSSVPMKKYYDLSSHDPIQYQRESIEKPLHGLMKEENELMQSRSYVQSPSFGYSSKGLSRQFASPGLPPMHIPGIPSRSDSSPGIPSPSPSFHHTSSMISSSSNMRSAGMLTPGNHRYSSDDANLSRHPSKHLTKYDAGLNHGTSNRYYSNGEKNSNTPTAQLPKNDAIVHPHKDKKMAIVQNGSKEVIVIGDRFAQELENQTGDARSVGSSTLDGLLARIENTKEQLEKTKDGGYNTQSPRRLRTLIETLTTAAAQMEQFDELSLISYEN